MATPPPYTPDPDRYAGFQPDAASDSVGPAPRSAAAGAAGCDLPGDLARAVAQLRRRPCRSKASAPSCAARSISASPTSTWPTTTARPTAAPRRTSARSTPQDFRPYRDELVISTKAGYDMWPGPYGQGGGRASTCWRASTSRWRRMGVDYVDIFYSHRFDPETPLEETMGALDTAVRSGQGAVRRHLVLRPGAHPRGRRDPAASWARRC